MSDPTDGIHFRSKILEVQAQPANHFPICAAMLRRFVDWIFGPIRYRVRTEATVSIDGRRVQQQFAMRHVGETYGCIVDPLVLEVARRRGQAMHEEIVEAGDEFQSAVNESM